VSAAEKAVHDMRVAAKILADSGNRTMAVILGASAIELEKEIKKQEAAK